MSRSEPSRVRLRPPSLYALSNVLQQSEAEQVASKHAMRLGLLARLARRPRWLVGIAADVGGYVFEALALAAGAVVLVEPILSTALLLSLFLGAAINKRHVGRLVVGRRRRARGRRGTVRQIGVRRPGGHATALAVVVTGRSAAARRRRGLYRWGSCHVGAQPARALLGAGTGVAFGVTALLTKGFVHFSATASSPGSATGNPTLSRCAGSEVSSFSEPRSDRLARGGARRRTGHAAASASPSVSASSTRTWAPRGSYSRLRSLSRWSGWSGAWSPSLGGEREHGDENGSVASPEHFQFEP